VLFHLISLVSVLRFFANQLYYLFFLTILPYLRQDGFVNQNPLIYFFGQSSPKDNVDLYKILVTNLASKVNARLERDCDARASGIIVNTSGWVDGVGYDVLLHCINAFLIDVVLVMSSDKLYSSLVTSLDANSPTGKSSVTVVKLPRSGGVVSRVSALSLNHS